MTNNYLYITNYADDGNDDYDYTCCYSSIRFRDTTDASFYGAYGDCLPNR